MGGSFVSNDLNGITHPLRQVTESGTLTWLNGRLTSCRILL